MANQPRNGAHQKVIQRLINAEKEAREQVRQAETEADDIIESAEREADERVGQAEESAESEAKKIVSEARDEAEKRAGGPGTGIGSIDGLRQHAEENMDAAVRFLVGRITERSE
jgi:V/A-type H+/Na+-transporting ATPase subunit G/H